MILFIASIFVNVVGIIFNARLAQQFGEFYEKRLLDTGTKVPPGLSPGTIGGWSGYVADVAANFPSSILLIVAFAELSAFESKAGVVVLLCVTVAICLYAAWRTGPRFAATWEFKHVTPWSGALLVANGIGIYLAK